MKILIYLFFVAICFVLLFFLNNSMTRKQGFTLYGASLVLLPILALAFMAILKVSGFQPGPDFKGFFFAILMSLATLILVSLIVLIGDLILASLTGFQEQHNSANLNRQPVSFALKNKNNIMLFYRGLFFLGSCLGLYGVWFDMNVK
jgi:hypothetical protein